MNRRYAALLSAVLLLALLLCACAKKQEEGVNPVTFYYLSGSDQFGTQTGALAGETVDLLRTDLELNEIVELYLQGSADPAFSDPFPNGLHCEQAELLDGSVRVRLTPEIETLSGVELTLAEACLTKTLTEMTGAETVVLETQNGVLPGGESGVFSTEQFILWDELSTEPES